MKVSIIIPVYNEEATIENVISMVNSVNLYAEKEIIVVDDCSTDGTRKKLSKMKGKNKNLRLCFHEKNMGKGNALKTGLMHATGDIVIFQDADLEYDPKDYGKLIKPIIEGKASAVYGSRFLGKPKDFIKKYKGFLPLNYIGNKILTILTNILYGSKLTDMDTCYTVFRRDVIKKLNLRSSSFEITPEITAKILKNGVKIHEVPINYNPRSHSSGKKLTIWKDGFKALYSLVKYRFLD